MARSPGVTACSAGRGFFGHDWIKAPVTTYNQTPQGAVGKKSPRRREPKLAERVYRTEFYRLGERDGWQCFYCRHPFDEWVHPTIDHVVPVSKGGRSTPANTVLACFPCNQDKADLTLVEWLAIMEQTLAARRSPHLRWEIAVAQLRSMAGPNGLIPLLRVAG